jgi:acetylornithine deacetylase
MISDQALGHLQQLVATPSVTGEETAAVDLVAEWLQAADPDVLDRWNASLSDLESDPAYPGREVEREVVPVVAAAIVGGSPGPTVTLTGHIDTVPPGGQWSRDPWQPFRHDDRLYGLGACDMKGGLVAAIHTFLHIATGPRSFPGRLEIVVVPGEEDGGTGTLAAIRRGWGGDLVIITEPTSRGGSPQVVVAHGGALTLTVEVPGKSAHASMPDQGENALDHFQTVYQALRSAEQRATDRETNPLMLALGRPYATSVGVVAGGVWSASVMAHLRAEVRMGVAVGETVAEAEQRIIGTVLEVAAQDPWLSDNPPTVTRTGAAFGSASTPADHPLPLALMQASQQVTGQRTDVVGVPYGCDMAMWQQAGGSTAVVYGPGDVRQAHTADEWVSLTEIATVSSVLTEACSRLLTG